MVISARRGRQEGSSAVVILIMIIIFLILFAGIFDVCRILMYREHTRNAADAISLAVAQEMVFFEYRELNSIAEKMAGNYRCRLESLNITYDLVTVSVVSEIKLLLLDRFRDDVWNVESVSSAEITYPWDTRLGLYRYYEFSFTDNNN
ncbi:pilus assembly protein TadG-related protein [Actinomycetota bacterium]